MTEQQQQSMAERLTKIEKALKGVSAAAWNKIDAVELSQLNRAIGQLQAEIDHLEILQGKTPRVNR